MDSTVDETRSRLLENRDDSKTRTFMYSLWEDRIFDSKLCESMVSDFELLANNRQIDNEIAGLAKWVIGGVDLVFRSHHDPHDFARIVNYDESIEKRWRSDWQPRLRSVVGRLVGGGASEIDNVRDRILDNRYYSEINTFCHELLSGQRFDAVRCEKLVQDIEWISSLGGMDKDISNFVDWLVYEVSSSFESHHDPTDIKKIENYEPSAERRWMSVWLPRLKATRV